MALKRLFSIPLIITMGIFPLTMNSADIYERSRWWGRIISNLNPNIVTDDSKLDSTMLIVKTKEEYKAPEIYSKCLTWQKLALSEKIKDNYIYIISFKYLWSCSDNTVYLKNWDEIYTDTAMFLNLSDYAKNFTDFSDLSDKNIEERIAKTDIAWMKLDEEIPSLLEKRDLASKMNLIGALYEKKWAEYENIFLSNMLSTRKSLKYISPVAGKVIPIKRNIIPNAGRPYREKYTDWIHHGWDVFASHWTPVRALADGVIVRISNDFNWSKFDNIKWKNLTDEDKARNLDIYRWNQVWLKTADWNVIIYSHLENIPSKLKQWQYVKEWEFFWQVWRSWVPDKEYKDFHLHFEVQVNPYLKKDNSPIEIMMWKYYGKWMKYDSIVKGELDLFKQWSVAPN
ncbi:MAG: Peptidase M23 [uncultured bacterium (gcode 4)]|uniref:Peptidase M23 n=1 Tax=uncultured bacterium (gcode 4) TaxID=1234023 RepID=K2FE80_9BACT|nr:MAG: Peptidase M23 [uncultured bacterium (gcode 4)]